MCIGHSLGREDGTLPWTLSIVPAIGCSLDSCSSKKLFLEVVVAKKDELGQHKNSGDISPGQGIGDTVGGWGSLESCLQRGRNG